MTGATNLSLDGEESITIEEHERRMREFRATVRAEAMRMAHESDLCSEVEATLKRVGIGTKVHRVKRRVTEITENTYSVPDELIALYATEAEFIADFIRMCAGEFSDEEDRAWREVQHENEEVESVSDEVLLLGEVQPTVWWLYAGDGTVKHAISSVERPARQKAACGQFPAYGRWGEHARRATNGAHCQRCTNSLKKEFA